MPKRTNDFQAFIRLIYGELADQGATVTESKLLRDVKTGMEREVDIVIESTYLGQPICVAIECRGRGRKDTTEWIDSLVGKYRDLPVDRVYAVSKSGFTDSARMAAAANRIVPLTLKQAEASDWGKLVGEIKPTRFVNVVTVRPAGVTFNGVSDIETIPTLERANPTEITIVAPGGESVGNPLDYFYSVTTSDRYQKYLESLPLSMHFPASIQVGFPPGTMLLDTNGKRHFVSEVVYFVEYDQETITIELEPSYLESMPVAVGEGSSNNWQIRIALVKEGSKEATQGMQLSLINGTLGPGRLTLYGLESAPGIPN